MALDGVLIAIEEDLADNKFTLEQSEWVAKLVDEYEKVVDRAQDLQQKLNDQEQANQHVKHQLAETQALLHSRTQVLGVIQFALNGLNK